ncbi:hypothetical protein AVDCRST_MAG84-6958 [uncultured Microcoleus sp.]|uniref:Uncharacterized protein n=1 Tax=uncultured Microcoleus sp. TaxID=259945 RepID=A0A6J4PRE5_9CYAN|nr:hypothetical protein AVDCRST_MAG84-6958 [uncultured Microcoleus sp.]
MFAFMSQYLKWIAVLDPKIVRTRLQINLLNSRNKLSEFYFKSFTSKDRCADLIILHSAFG